MPVSATAAPPPGKGKPAVSTATSTTPRKVTLCHKTGSGKWVKVTGWGDAAEARSYIEHAIERARQAKAAPNKT